MHLEVLSPKLDIWLHKNLSKGKSQVLLIYFWEVDQCTYKRETSLERSHLPVKSYNILVIGSIHLCLISNLSDENSNNEG